VILNQHKRAKTVVAGLEPGFVVIGDLMIVQHDTPSGSTAELKTLTALSFPICLLATALGCAGLWVGVLTCSICLVSFHVAKPLLPGFLQIGFPLTKLTLRLVCTPALFGRTLLPGHVILQSALV
jgi:hypothetical protein